MTDMTIPSEAMNEAIARFPEEACGLVVAVGKKTRWIACANVSVEAKDSFKIDPLEYARVSQIGEVIGVWHTHVNEPPTPSPADMVGCETSGLPWYVFSIYKAGDDFSFSCIDAIQPCGFVMPYTDRPYVFGVFDCWSLVRDYYAREYQIALGDYPRINDFWKTHRFFSENWKKEGFVRLDDEEPQVGDVFLIQTDSFGEPNHAAIYVGDDMILHHAYKRLSSRDVYGGGYWQRHTVSHYRHGSKVC